MRRTAIILFFILSLLPLRHSHAQSPAIDAGVGYLTSTQNPDRSWGGAGGSNGTVASTVTVLDTLKLLNQTDLYEYSGAMSWLQNQNLDTTEHLSERINTLTIGGADADRLLAYLDSLMNAWGGYNDYGVSIIDTVQALQALKTINHEDPAVFVTALNFLITNQNADGGWGFYKTDSSNTYVTSMVLNTLARMRSTYTGLQTPLDRSVVYVLSKQNPDGGFGSSPSSVHETALAYEALVSSGADVSISAPQAINYIAVNQLQNGSWNSDAYATALAVRALSNIKPNLTLSSSDITFSDTTLTVKEQITLTAAIKNSGLVNAERVTVQFYDSDPAKGGQPFYSQILQTLAAGEIKILSFPYIVRSSGNQTLFVVLDPENTIAEVNEDDNIVSKPFLGMSLPDLAINPEDIVPTTFYPAPDALFDVVFKIRNLGDTRVYPVNITLFDGDPANGGVVLGHGMPVEVKGGEVGTNVIAGVSLSGSGFHTLYLMADPDGLVMEISETNNKASFTINVGGTPPNIDLEVTPQRVTLTPSRPFTGDVVRIEALVRNNGQEGAPAFTVEFYDGAPGTGTLIASRSLALAAGYEQTVTADWTIPEGIHTVYTIIDRANQISETNELNNQAITQVMADMVDLSVSATDLTFNPAHPVQGDTVDFSFTVRNGGIKDTGMFTVGLYDGDPSFGGVLVNNFPVSNIPGDGSQVLTYTFTAEPKLYRFTVKADTENVVTEMYEDNNLAIRSLKIKAPGEVLGPDLVPIKIDLSSMVTDTRSLAISGSAHVTFQNKGDAKIELPFNVSVFEDKDNDGVYTSGVDNLLGMSTMVTGPTASIPAIWPEGAGMVSVPLSGTVKFLHSPLYAMVDSVDAILEQNESNNLLISCKDCEVRPTNAITPALKQSFSFTGYGLSAPGISSTPIVANLIDTNSDGKVDGTDAPVLLFITYQVYGVQGRANGKIDAVRGDTGAELFTIFDLARPLYYGGPSIAVADVDNDGYPEIIVPSFDGSQGHQGHLYAYDNTGTFKWDNLDSINTYLANHAKSISIGSDNEPAIADLDNDGLPEIIVGSTAFNGDGSVKWAGVNTSGAYHIPGHGCEPNWPSIAADIDLDGRSEVLCGNTAYNADGTIKWWNKSIPDVNTYGYTAAVNMNDDIYPEIVFYYYGKLYLLDHNGNILWGPVTPDQEYSLWPTPPVVADIDGDGELEIILTFPKKYIIVNKNGLIKKTISILCTYCSDGGQTAGSVFDLDGDGRPELLTNSFEYFRIFDGKEGTLLNDMQNKFGAAGAMQQNVIVSDVDRDGHAEAVVAGFNYVTRMQELRVYGSADPEHPWVNSRTIWNQASYHVTNVNDNGTIPQHEAPSWLLNNSYRTQAAIGHIANPYLTPNLTASLLRASQDSTGINLTIRVGNGGAKEALAGAPVNFYDGLPATGALLGTALTTRVLQPGEYQDLILGVSSLAEGLHHVYAVVNECLNSPNCPNRISECNYDDNQAELDLTIATGLPDLKVGTEDIAVSAAPITEGSIIPVIVTVRNIGLVSASNIEVKLSNGDTASGGAWTGLPQTINTIDAGGSTVLTFFFDTLGHAGQNMLYVSIDPDSTVIEATRANNIALVSINVQQPQFPNFVIDMNSIQFVPANPREGEQVTITATVANRGASAGNVPVRFGVRGQGSGVNEENYSETKTIYPILSLGQSATITTAFDTAGLAGQRSIVVTVDPANTITESDKNDNGATKPIFIQSAGLTCTVLLDKASYQANENMTATVTLASAATETRFLVPAITVKDSSGNLIAAVSSGDTVNIGPNSTVTLTRTWNVGRNLAGNYSVTAEVAEGGLVISRTNAGFTITPDKNIASKVTTDKISYKPNETAAITSTITSQSLNYVMENLTLKVSVALPFTGNGNPPGINPDATIIYTETKTITTLMPGASFTFKSYWNTGNYAPGTYPVTLEVKDTAGTVIATGTQNLVISNVATPRAALRGLVSVDKQSLMAGEPVNVSYSVTNVGNADLPAVFFTVQTVHVAQQTVYDTIVSQASITMGGVQGSIVPIDTMNYSAMDYLVILRANIGGVEETLSGTYFRVEGAPTVPALIAPAVGSDVDTFTPALTVSNASDPNDDKLTYELELYADSGLTQLITSSGVSSQESGVTSWQVPMILTENATYYWRARAYDGMLYGLWMEAATFRVNAVNDPPSAPIPTSPAEAQSVSTVTPVLTVNNASDPDSAGLTYNFDIALDPDFISMVTSTIGVFSGDGITSWQVAPGLAENTWYYWRAQADDWLTTGAWSTTASFFVNITNEAPTVPAILAPASNGVVAGLGADIVLANSTDPDSAVISYFIELDTVPTFDSAGILRSGSVAQGQGTTTWHAAGLQDNALYFVRAKSSDGEADSAWSSALSFHVNMTNDGPTAPTLENPSIGAGVNVFMPQLSVHNAADLDRDALTYEFEVYADAGLVSRVAYTAGVIETEGITSWIVAIPLTENQAYWWRARAFDGQANGLWMQTGSFTVNTANDAPGAPTLSSPLDAATIATFLPTLSVTNATDPDSDALTYDFEISSGTTPVWSRIAVPQDQSGTTSVSVTTALADNTTYQWRARAYDGDRYGPWTVMAAFTVHVQQVGINVEIEVEPETLNQKSHGNWVMVEIELPHGYHASDVDISSIRLEGVIPAETRPYNHHDHHHDHGCEHDDREHDHDELKVKFDRNAVIAVLPIGNHVPVHVTGRIGSVTFEGVDFIRVIH